MPQRSNVNAKNLEQNSQYLWNILFSRRSVWVLLELVGRWTQNFKPKSTRRHVKLDKFVFVTPWLPDLLSKHWFESSVWNLCRWVVDVPPPETSPAAKSEEKRMFSQARSEVAVSSKHSIVTVNPLLSLPGGWAYLFHAHLRGGGGWVLIETRGLFERGISSP